MRKFKKVIAGVIATASIMTCTAISASAATISIRTGQAGSQANIIGAKQVYYTAECARTSRDSANFRLAYSSGSSLINVDTFTLYPGQTYADRTIVYDTGKMWTYQVIAPNNNLNTTASGTIEALMY